MKNEKRRQQSSYIPIFVLLLLILLTAVAVVLWVKHAAGETDAAKAAGEAAASGDGSSQTVDMGKWQEGAIRYNGVQYRYNPSVKAYLFMGVDKDGPAAKAADGISGGQSDAMFLLVEDADKEKLSLIAINRNAMTDVEVYSKAGDYVTTQPLQVCLQYGFGDGMRTSCQRSADAVSRLFYDLPISGYMAMYMDAMPIANDAVGGVSVEVMQDLEAPARGVSLKQGETVTLNGDQAYVYLRYRDINEFDSASRRMERQMQYISAFLGKAGEAVRQDETAAARIYHSIEDYIVTNLDFLRLVENAVEYEFDSSQVYTLPGETVMGNDFEEFYVDDEALYELVLDIFYEPVEEQ